MTGNVGVVKKSAAGELVPWLRVLAALWQTWVWFLAPTRQLTTTLILVLGDATLPRQAATGFCTYMVNISSERQMSTHIFCLLFYIIFILIFYRALHFLCSPPAPP